MKRKYGWHQITAILLALMIGVTGFDIYTVCADEAPANEAATQESTITPEAVTPTPAPEQSQAPSNGNDAQNSDGQNAGTPQNVTPTPSGNAGDSGNSGNTGDQGGSQTGGNQPGSIDKITFAVTAIDGYVSAIAGTQPATVETDAKANVEADYDGNTALTFTTAFNMKAGYELSCVEASDGFNHKTDLTKSLFDTKTAKANFGQDALDEVTFTYNPEQKLISITNVKTNVNLALTFKATEYKISYTLKDDTASPAANDNPASYTVNDEVTLKDPTRTGYTFTGWTSDTQTTPVKSYKIAAGTTGEINLKANWSRNQYTITYDGAGGTFKNGAAKLTETHYYGDTITIEGAPSRDGYSFHYWQGSSYRPGDKYTVTGDHTFTAVWIQNSTPASSNVKPKSVTARSRFMGVKSRGSSVKSKSTGTKSKSSTVKSKTTVAGGTKSSAAKTGDVSNTALYMNLLNAAIFMLAVIAILSCRDRKKYKL